jgi:hypothetical protein
MWDETDRVGRSDPSAPRETWTTSGTLEGISTAKKQGERWYMKEQIENTRARPERK